MRRRTRPKRRRLLVAALTAAVLLGFAVFLLDLRRPVDAMVPSAPPSTEGAHACPGRDGLSRVTGFRRPWVDEHPTGAVVLWVPGINAKPCQMFLTRLDSQQAGVLAQAVRTAGAGLHGVVNCPMDDGSSATVYFIYPDRPLAEVVRFELSGCGGLSAPGRTSRTISDSAYAIFNRRAAQLH